MEPRCTCGQNETVHHHAFGGTYPCEGPQTCIRCRPVERQQPNGRGGLETRKFSMIETRIDTSTLETR